VESIMTRSGLSSWIGPLASLPGACAATAYEGGGTGLLLIIGILGLGGLTLLSERWPVRDVEGLRLPPSEAETQSWTERAPTP